MLRIIATSLKKKYFSLLCLLGLIPGIVGCSNMYEGIKSVTVNDCYKLNYPEQQECLDQADVSYEMYEKERKL